MNPDNLTIYDVINLVRRLSNDQIVIIQREKNSEFMYRLGISEPDAKDYLRKLTVDDFFEGPLIDENPERKHFLWVFKKNVRGVLAYIKLKIINYGRIAIVISFHEDEFN